MKIIHAFMKGDNIILGLGEDSEIYMYYEDGWRPYYSKTPSKVHVYNPWKKGEDRRDSNQ